MASCSSPSDGHGDNGGDASSAQGLWSDTFAAASSAQGFRERLEDKFQTAVGNSDDDILVSPGSAGLSVMLSSLDFNLPLSAIKKTMEQDSFEETHDF